MLRILLYVLLACLLFQAAPSHAADPRHKSGDSDKKADAKPKYIENQILVRFRDNVPESKRAAAHARVNGKSLKAFRHVQNLELVKLPPGVSVEKAIESYRGHPDVLYAEPNYRVELHAVPNDTNFTGQWHLQNTGQFDGTPGADIKAVPAWDITTGSEEVVIAVIDTGVDYRHHDLAANMWRNEADCNNNGIDDDGNGYIDDCWGINRDIDGDITVTDPMDVDGHGTLLAGLIGAVGNNNLGVAGVNWKIKILPCVFWNGLGIPSLSSALECLDYVKTMKDRGVNIVATNNSWGYSGPSQAVTDAIEAQRQSGILFISSAGNRAENNDIGGITPQNQYPSNLITVAATDQRDELTDFSSYGPHTVHLGAPGWGLFSTYLSDTYDYLTGTSTSAALVTGVAALLKAQDPSRDWRAIKNLILAGADVLPSMAGATITGGRLNAFNSLTCANRVVLTRLRPMSDAMFVNVGRPVNLAALHINCANPNGAIQVTINPGNHVITLQDDGSGHDQVTGDGIYSAVWTPQTTGIFTVTFPGDDVVTVEVLPNETVWCEEGIKRVSDTIVGDGTGGAIFVTGKYDVTLGNILFAHRLAPDGRRVWDTSGVTLAVLGRFGTESTNIINDGGGGAFITWKQLFPASTMRVLRIDSMGIIRWQAIISSKVAGNEFTPELAVDGAGGVIVTWWIGEANQVSLWGQRFTGDGQALWGPDGKRIFAGPYNTFSNAKRVSDAHGGVIVSWITGSPGNLNSAIKLSVQRINQDGLVLWQPGGVLVVSTGDMRDYAVSADDEGGAVLAWDWVHYPGDPSIIPTTTLQAQRVDAAGNLAWGTGVSDVAVAWGYGTIAVTNDGAGGGIILWESQMFGTNHIGLRRIDHLGNTIWHYDQAELLAVTWHYAQLISDGAGGAIVAYNDVGFDVDGRMEPVSSVVERFDGNGNWLWATRVGNPMTIGPQMVSDEMGGAILHGAGLAQRVNDSVEPYKICQASTSTLTVVTAGTGSGSVKSEIAGIDCGADCTATYENGTSIVLSAIPNAGSVFDGWSGDGDCNDGALTMDANKNCTATFTAQWFQLSVTKSGAGGGSVMGNSGGINCGANCNSAYLYNNNVVLSAIPDANSLFMGWTGGCTGFGPCNLQMTANRSVTANFAKRLTLTAPAPGGIWPLRSTQTIRWTTSETTVKVIIQISRDGGVTWKTLTKTGNDGAQNWKVSKPATGQARIRVCSLKSPSVCDTSAPFTIQ